MSAGEEFDAALTAPGVDEFEFAVIFAHIEVGGVDIFGGSDMSGQFVVEWHHKFPVFVTVIQNGIFAADRPIFQVGRSGDAGAESLFV